MVTMMTPMLKYDEQKWFECIVHYHELLFFAAAVWVMEHHAAATAAASLHQPKEWPATHCTSTYCSSRTAWQRSRVWPDRAELLPNNSWHSVGIRRRCRSWVPLRMCSWVWESDLRSKQRCAPKRTIPSVTVGRCPKRWLWHHITKA